MRARAAFESKCHLQCLALAAKATELEPNNVEYWRLRALLLRWNGSQRGETPMEVLYQCARHDPDNGLYDYLAAEHWWALSFRIEFSRSKGPRRVIKDVPIFLRGVACFERGQAKTHFATADSAFPPAVEFLRETELPLEDRLQIVTSRRLVLRRSALLRSLSRTLQFRADDCVAAGNVEEALALLREDLHLINQFQRGLTSKSDEIAVEEKVRAAVALKKLADAHSDFLAPQEATHIDAIEEDAMLEQYVIQEAFSELAAGNSDKLPSIGPSGLPVYRDSDTAGDRRIVILTLLVNLWASLVVSLVLIALLGIVLAHILKDGCVAMVAARTQFFGLVIALFVTAVVFGLAPAEIISRGVQSWVLTVLVILAPIISVAWFVWSWLRRKNFRFSLRAMMLWIFVFCFVLGIVSITRPAAADFARVPFKLWIPGREWGQLDAYSGAQEYGRWAWAMFQWSEYKGGHLTLAIWIALLALFAIVKAKDSRQGAEVTPFTARERCGIFAFMLGRSCAVLAALILMAYLVAAPEVVRTVENNFQRDMAFARDPDSYWAEVNEAVCKVRSNEKLMSELRASVEVGRSEAGDVSEE